MFLGLSAVPQAGVGGLGGLMVRVGLGAIMAP